MAAMLTDALSNIRNLEQIFDGPAAVKFCGRSMHHIVALCVMYCCMIYAGRRYMENRKPFDLRRTLAAWNLLLSIFSLCGSIKTVPFALNFIYQEGLYHSMCCDALQAYGSKPVGVWITLFIFSKVPELFDTVFIVLRKKPLIFLHWYHHITVLLFCWHAFAHSSPNGIYFIAMNYSVHAVMYFYYFLVALRYRPRWARLVTVLQLSQMVVGVIVCSFDVFYILGGLPCHISRENLKWGIIMYMSYFFLFLKFFLERYFVCRQTMKKIQ